MNQPPEHYFSAEPSAPADRRTVRVRLAGRDLEVRTAAGVFSGDRLDLGSSVLLREAPPPPPGGHFLDLGCGWGALALTLGLLAPAAHIWAVDVNARALDLARENAQAAGVALQAVPPGDVPADVWFDLVWSNPPIRIGKAALHALLLDWLPRLAPGGSAYLVVQRNLGADSLHSWLTGALPPDQHVERHASAKGFRVLHVWRDPATGLRPPA